MSSKAEIERRGLDNTPLANHSRNQCKLKGQREGHKRITNLTGNGKDKASKAKMRQEQTLFMSTLPFNQMIRIFEHKKSTGITNEEATYFNKHKAEHEEFAEYPMIKPDTDSF